MGFSKTICIKVACDRCGGLVTWTIPDPPSTTNPSVTAVRNILTKRGWQSNGKVWYCSQCAAKRRPIL